VSFNVSVEVVAVEQDAAPVAAGVELAESDQVVYAVLAATKSFGGLRDVQPRRDGGSGLRDEGGGTLSYLGELLVGEGSVR